jgi:hypothetical protein
MSSFSGRKLSIAEVAKKIREDRREILCPSRL